MSTVTISNARPVLGISRDITAAEATAVITAWKGAEAPAAVAVYYLAEAMGQGAGRRLAADYGLSTATVSRLRTSGALMVRVGARLTARQADAIITAVNYGAHKGIGADLRGAALVKALTDAAAAEWARRAAAADPEPGADDESAESAESAPESAPAAPAAAPEPTTPEALVAEAIRLLRKAERAGYAPEPRQAEALVQVVVSLSEKARKAATATA